MTWLRRGPAGIELVRAWDFRLTPYRRRNGSTCR